MDEEKSQLFALVKQFIDANRIHCPDAIYQRDSLIEKASEFMEMCCNVVGYVELED